MGATGTAVWLAATLMAMWRCAGTMNVVQGPEEGGVSLLWGIADTTAMVGRAFRYHIPADAFKGDIKAYEVAEAGKSALPKWLTFKPDLNLLEGIPAPGDAGQLYLEVLAISSDGVTRANDVFSVFVSADSPAMSLAQPVKFKGEETGPEAVHCKSGDPETVATLVVDLDLEALPADQRLTLLDKFLGHMGLQPEVVKLIPAQARLLQDDTALVTGSGDVSGEPVEGAGSGAALSWLVGCGKVEASHFPLLQTLDSDSGSGTMRQALGHGVVGWRVTNSRFTERGQAQKRRRRQVRPTPTPSVTLAPPTATDQVPTDVDRMTRKVVEMASPTFTIQPTPTQPLMPQTTTPSPSPSTTPAPTPAPTTTTKSTTKSTTTKATTAKPTPKPPRTTTPSSTTTTTTTTTTTAAPTTRAPRKPEAPKSSTEAPTTKAPTTKAPVTKKPTTMALDTMKPEPTMKPVPVPECTKPILLAQPESLHLKVNLGEMFSYHFPENMFDACGKGGTSQTSLEVFKDASKKIPDDWFMKFDPEKHSLRGMATEEKDEGIHNMTLVARLDKQSTAHIIVPFSVHIRKVKARRNKANHELSVTIDTDYDRFVADVDNKVDLTNKVALVFGDVNANAITVTDLSRGSVKYSYFNRTLPTDSCPSDRLRAMVDMLVTEDSQLTQHARHVLSPWVLVGASAQPKGNCENDPDFPRRSAMMEEDKSTPKDVMPKSSTMQPGPTSSGKNLTAKAGTERGDDIWITTVVPAVVIVAILLVALCVACILYRKKRKGKMSLEDQNTFVNKGAPVIFPDELEEKPSDATKPLLHEGSPPAPPPEYHGQRGPSLTPERSNGAPKELTPPMEHEVEADLEVDVTSPLYQPPPPVTASSGKQARPQGQQPYRVHPPEIQP